MADDKAATDPGAAGKTTRDAQFLNREFGVRPDAAAALSTDSKAEADRTETAVRQANSGGAVPGATSPEASSVQVASDTNEDANKPLVNTGNDEAGPS